MTFKATVIAVLAPPLLAGCVDPQRMPPYRLMAIEMRMQEWAENRGGEEYDFTRGYIRFCFAGPAAVPELVEGFDSDRKKNRDLAAYILHGLTSNDRWPEAYEFAVKRLKRLPRPASEEAGSLLYALANGDIRGYPEVLPFAATYLEDEQTARTFLINSPDNRVEMRACDFAAYIVQVLSGVDFGFPLTHQAGHPRDVEVCPAYRSDKAVRKARAWVEKNMVMWEAGKKIFIMPSALRKK